MRKTTKCTLSATAVLSLSVLTANALPVVPTINHGKYAYRTELNHQAFNNPRAKKITELNARLAKKDAFHSAPSATEQPQPTTSFGPVSTFSSLDGPNGQTWFYTIDYTYETIQHDFYVEKILRAYEVKIFDNEFNPVGFIKDKMRYAEDEVRSPYCDLLPVVTSKFFNPDDRIEIAVGIGVNTTIPGINRYRTLVYQIDGEKDNEGNNLPIVTLPDLINDVLDASTPAGRECHYMTVMLEEYPTEEPDEWEGEALWNYMLQSKMILQVYKPAEDATGPKQILSCPLQLQSLPGDQENSPFLMSTVHNGTPYFVTAHYGETLYNPIYDITQDVSQRESNTLVIDVYKLGNEAEKVQTTTIPFVKGSEEDNVIASYYSVGDFRYRGDLIFEDGGKVAFIISKGEKFPGNDESLIHSYYYYNADGTRRSVIFENAESSLSLSDVKGFESQEMFMTTENGEYVFNFVDLPSCKLHASFSYLLEIEDGDPDRLTANLDRIASGDSYVYANELRMPTDEDGNTIMRIAWLDNKGKHIRTDEVNMGTDIKYATCYINGIALDPKFFHSDDNMEYMILLKRGIGDETTQEELLIGKALCEDYPEGQDLLLLAPNEWGSLKTIMPFTGEKNRLMVSYYNNDSGKVDFYDLPFDKYAGIEDVATDTENLMRISGNTVSAPGLAINIYNLQGVCLASGNDSLELKGLGAGIYLVSAGGHTVKVSVR